MDDGGIQKLLGTDSRLPNGLRSGPVARARGGPESYTFIAFGPLEFTSFAMRIDGPNTRTLERGFFFLITDKIGYFGAITKLPFAAGLDGERTIIQSDYSVGSIPAPTDLPGPVFLDDNGIRIRVIGAGDQLNGKRVLDVSLSRKPLSGSTCALLIEFWDGSEAVYTATVTP